MLGFPSICSPPDVNFNPLTPINPFETILFNCFLQFPSQFGLHHQLWEHLELLSSIIFMYIWQISLTTTQNVKYHRCSVQIDQSMIKVVSVFHKLRQLNPDVNHSFVNFSKWDVLWICQWFPLRQCHGDGETFMALISFRPALRTH